MTTIVWHGAYGRRSQFELFQHRYGSTECEADDQGYVELLEVRNAPEGRCRWLLHSFFRSDGSTFHEFETDGDARAAWSTFITTAHRWRRGLIHDEDRTNPLMGLSGYVRTVYCGLLKPWFYADEDEEVSADFTI